MISSTRPFSGIEPGVLAGTVDGRVRYAFNFDNPTGVKLLSEGVYRRLQDYSTAAGRPVVPADERDQLADDILFQHGLVRRQGAYAAQPQQTVGLSLAIWLNIVDACNLGCFYCYIPELQKSIDPNSAGLGRFALDDDTAGLVAERLVAYCAEKRIKRLFVKFAGGEPTLVIDRVERFCERLVAIAGELDVGFGMLTNGAFDPVKVLPAIDRWGMKISISVDGMAENHDRIRFQRDDQGARKGTWAAVQANAERLLERGTEPYFLYTITRKTLGDVAAFAEHTHALGCGFRLSLERADRPVDFETQRQTADYLVNFYTSLAKTTPVGLRFDRAARFAEWNLRRKKRLACTTCRGYVAVGRDGRVSSCQMRLDEPVGNLRDHSLSDSMERFSNLEQSRKLQHPEEKTGGCTRCEFRFVCAGGCPQHTRDVWGDLDRPSPWCFVYGTLAPKYVEACAVHLARRLDAATEARAA